MGELPLPNYYNYYFYFYPPSFFIKQRNKNEKSCTRKLRCYRFFITLKQKYRNEMKKNSAEILENGLYD